MSSKFRIYSVNPVDIMVSAGQFGTMTAKGAGNKLYGSTTILNHTLLKDLGGDNFQPHVVKAEEIAKDLADRYEEDGVFVTENGDEPDPKTITVQIEAFKQQCIRRCRHADAMWDRKHDRELIEDRARRAARYLGITPPWADAATDDLKECPYCAEDIKARAKFCKHCHHDLEARAEVPAKTK